MLAEGDPVVTGGQPCVKTVPPGTGDGPAGPCRPSSVCSLVSLGCWWLALGLGVATIPAGDPRSPVLLAVVAGLLAWRRARARPLAVVPDLLVTALPFLWAANATDGFQAWWLWMRWVLLVAGGAALLDLWGRPASRRAWRQAGFGTGAVLAVGGVVLFASFLYTVFPLFTPALYGRVLRACLVFFGGLLIGQAAWASSLRGA